MKKISGTFAAFMLALCMMLTLLPMSALASENSMSFGDFLTAVETGKGTFDGNGVTVKWEPDESVNIIHRIQNNNAQYQMFGDLADISISNVNFEYVPADIPNHSDGWSGINKDWTKDEIRNAEFQFLNSGSLTVTNCTFEKIIVSPYGDQNNRAGDAQRSATVTGCSFSNVYNAYAVKDIYPATAEISNNTFNNCSGAIYFEGSIPRQKLTVSGNAFNDIDEYAAQGKKNTRGIIQFSSACVLSGDTVFSFSGNTITGNTVTGGTAGDTLPIIRQLCDLGEISVDGWTPGQAFSVKIDSDGKTLPDMPGGGSGGTYYEFIGWAASADYTGVCDLTNSDSFLTAGTAGANGVYYYAVWQAKYTVTYTDGVDDEEVFADQITKDIASGSDTPEFSGTPSREGYVFNGWSPEVAETVTSSVTYTATWGVDANGNGKDDSTEQRYTVTYTDGADGAVFENQVTKDLLSGAATPAFSGTPSREGYTFKGWSPEVSEKVTGDAVYTAQWEKEAAPENPDDAEGGDKPGETEEPSDPNVPQTGDHSVLAISAVTALVSGGICAIMAARKRRTSK